MNSLDKMRGIVQLWKKKYPLIIINKGLDTAKCPTESVRMLNFAFDKFFFQYNFEDGTEIVFVKLENGIQSGTSYILNENYDIVNWYHWSNLREVFIDDKQKLFLPDYKKYISLIEKPGSIHDRLLYSMEYIMTTDREKVQKDIYSKENVMEIKRKQNKKKYPHKIYMLSDIIEYVNEKGLKQETKGREINCPCWSVRGHYRHYKSGKTVFIKSYLKGKKREAEEPKAKEYYV